MNQAAFWAGEFGTTYTERNDGQAIIAANTALFARILQSCQDIKSLLEIGANRGLNLRAIRTLLPDVALHALEVNSAAAAKLREWNEVDVWEGDLLEYVPSQTFEFVLSKGVLIHLFPEMLPQVYKTLYQASNRYICLCEYYSPRPTEIPYRGHSGRMWKRDFAGEMLDKFPDLRLIDYGFVYHRDTKFPQDDINWFVLEKSYSSPK